MCENQVNWRKIFCILTVLLILAEGRGSCGYFQRSWGLWQLKTTWPWIEYRWWMYFEEMKCWVLRSYKRMVLTGLLMTGLKTVWYPGAGRTRCNHLKLVKCTMITNYRRKILYCSSSLVRGSRELVFILIQENAWWLKTSSGGRGTDKQTAT